MPHAKFNINHIYGIQENHSIEIFTTLYNHPASLTLIITEIHIFHVSQKSLLSFVGKMWCFPVQTDLFYEGVMREKWATFLSFFFY